MTVKWRSAHVAAFRRSALWLSVLERTAGAAPFICSALTYRLVSVKRYISIYISLIKHT